MLLVYSFPITPVLRSTSTSAGLEGREENYAQEHGVDHGLQDIDESVSHGKLFFLLTYGEKKNRERRT